MQLICFHDSSHCTLPGNVKIAGYPHCRHQSTDCVTLRAIDPGSKLRGDMDGVGGRVRNRVEGGSLAWLCGQRPV